MKVVIVGCGVVGKAHYERIRNKYNVTCVDKGEWSDGDVYIIAIAPGIRFEEYDEIMRKINGEIVVVSTMSYEVFKALESRYSFSVFPERLTPPSQESKVRLLGLDKNARYTKEIASLWNYIEVPKDVAVLAKIFENAIWALNIAIVEEITRKFGKEVIKAIKTHERLEWLPVPQIGIGGLCLPKDSKMAAELLDIFFYVESYDTKFRSHKLEKLIEKVQKAGGKFRWVGGFGYKPNVSITANSPAFEYYKALKERFLESEDGITVSAYGGGEINIIDL